MARRRIRSTALVESDFVIHTLLMREARGFLAAAAIGRMNRTPNLSHTRARGHIVDEPALLATLTATLSGHASW